MLLCDFTNADFCEKAYNWCFLCHATIWSCVQLHTTTNKTIRFPAFLHGWLFAHTGHLILLCLTVTLVLMSVALSCVCIKSRKESCFKLFVLSGLYSVERVQQLHVC